MAPIPRFHAAARWFSALPRGRLVTHCLDLLASRPNIAKNDLRFHPWSRLLCVCGSGVKRVQVEVNNMGDFVEHPGQCDAPTDDKENIFFNHFFGGVFFVAFGVLQARMAFDSNPPPRKAFSSPPG